MGCLMRKTDSFKGLVCYNSNCNLTLQNVEFTLDLLKFIIFIHAQKVF